MIGQLLFKKLIFRDVSWSMKSAPAGVREDAPIISTIETEGCGLLRVMHFRSRLDFMELRKRTQAGGFWLTGAAHAGNGEKRENGSGEGGKNTDHGS